MLRSWYNSNSNYTSFSSSPNNKMPKKIVYKKCTIINIISYIYICQSRDGNLVELPTLPVEIAIVISSSPNNKMPKIRSLPFKFHWIVLFVLHLQPLLKLFQIIKNHWVEHHAFADDDQLYKESTPDQIQQTTELMQTCSADVKSWMTINF